MQRSRFLLRAANRSFSQQHLRTLPSADVGALLLQSLTNSSPSLWFCRNLGSLLHAKHKSTWTSIGSIARAGSPNCLNVPRRHFLGLGDGDEDSGLTRQHEETRIVGYSPEQLFAVVAAVDLYQDFVPWCQKSTILWQKNETALDAELEIGFKFLVERYISHVELTRPSLIKTSVSQSSLFEYLINVWEFKPGPNPGTCNLHFSVDFQFRSPLYRQVANMFFEEVVSRLVGSFEQRCSTVYGPSTKILESTQTA